MKINKLKRFLILVSMIAALWTEAKCMDEATVLLDSERIGGKILLGAPGAEEWKDNHGNYAPSLVRKAGDELWESVKTEGGAAFDAGWGMGKQMEWGCRRGCLCCLTCGLMECLMASVGKYDEFGWNAQFRAQRRAEELIYDQKARDVTTFFGNFKEAVNQSVQQPERYSGDANMGVIGPWIEDGAWQYDNGLFVSGRRDLSGVFQSTKAFVTSHGGWISEK